MCYVAVMPLNNVVNVIIIITVNGVVVHCVLIAVSWMIISP